MLLQSGAKVEARCPRRWSLAAAGGLLALAVLIAGVRPQTVAAPAPGAKDDKKEEPKKAEPRKEEARKAPKLFPDVDEMLKRLPPGLDPAVEQRLRRQMEEMQKRMDKAMQGLPGAGLPGAGGLPALPGGIWIGPGVGVGRIGRAGMNEARLGAQVEPPSATLVDQLDLPKDQGQVLREIVPNSAAAKSGLKSHDILLELAGKAVSSKTDEFVKQVAGLKANTPIDAVVLRKGRKETVKGLSLPEAKPAVRRRPGGLVPFPNVFPGLPGAGAGLPGGVSITTARNNNEFTTTRQDGNQRIVVKGEIVAGSPTIAQVTIAEDGQTNTYDSVDKVPQAHQKTVKDLANLNARGARRLRPAL
jgi:serine protease Do